MTFAERVSSFLKKSFGGTGEEDDKGKKGEGSEEELNLEEGGENGEEEGMEKSNLGDATEIMAALVGELNTMNKSLSELTKRQDGIEKSQVDLGEAVVGVAELVSKIADTPNPLKGTLAKGGLGGNGAAGSGSGNTAPGVLTQPEFEQAQAVLTKSCAAKRLSIQQCTRLESEMQKAMVIPGYQMQPGDRALIEKELKTA